MNFSQILGKNRGCGLYSGATCSPENTVHRNTSIGQVQCNHIINSPTSFISTHNTTDIEGFISTVIANSVVIFTDGSVSNGPVGYDASAAVLYIPSNNNDPLVKSVPVGISVTSEECEIDAILLGIETLIDTPRVRSRSEDRRAQHGGGSRSSGAPTATAGSLSDRSTTLRRPQNAAQRHVSPCAARSTALRAVSRIPVTTSGELILLPLGSRHPKLNLG